MLFLKDTVQPRLTSGNILENDKGQDITFEEEEEFDDTVINDSPSEDAHQSELIDLDNQNPVLSVESSTSFSPY